MRLKTEGKVLENVMCFVSIGSGQTRLGACYCEARWAKRWHGVIKISAKWQKMPGFPHLTARTPSNWAWDTLIEIVIRSVACQPCGVQFALTRLIFPCRCSIMSSLYLAHCGIVYASLRSHELNSNSPIKC